MVNADDAIPTARRVGQAGDVFANDLGALSERLEEALERRPCLCFLVEEAHLAKHAMRRTDLRGAADDPVDVRELAGVSSALVDGREASAARRFTASISSTFVRARRTIGFLFFFPQAGGAEENLDFLLGRNSVALGLALEDTNELVPLLRLLVELLELVPCLEGHIAPLELLLGTTIVRRSGGAGTRDRAAVVVQLVAESIPS